MDKAGLLETQIMCGPYKPNDLEEIGHTDVLDGEDVHHAKFPMSALAKVLDIDQTGVLSSYYAIH